MKMAGRECRVGVGPRAYPPRMACVASVAAVLHHSGGHRDPPLHALYPAQAGSRHSGGHRGPHPTTIVRVSDTAL
jgi:hypothetical protein